MQVGDWVVLFAKIKPNAVIPSKRKEDASYDVVACIEDDVIIRPGEVAMIPTGIISAFSEKYRMILKERGSTGTKAMAQRAGVIDSGYRGEWLVPINNTGNKTVVITNQPDKWSFEYPYSQIKDMFTIYPATKAICQASLEIVPDVEVLEVTPEEVREIVSARGEGRLGSSGK